MIGCPLGGIVYARGIYRSGDPGEKAFMDGDIASLNVHFLVLSRFSLASDEHGVHAAAFVDG